MSYAVKTAFLSVAQLLRNLFLCIFCLALIGSKSPTELERVQASGKLQIISHNGPTTYYEGPHGLTGFEYTLAKAFAEELGVELAIHNEENQAILLDSVGTPRGHIGASSLTVTEERHKKVLFSAPYLEITQQVLYRVGSPKPTGIEDLIGKELIVLANSAHAERLRKLQKQWPELRWQERHDLEMVDLVEMVHSGKVPYAIVDSNDYAINRRVYPRARIGFEFEGIQQVAWAFPKQKDTSLYKAAQVFFQRIDADGTLDEIRDRFYGHIDKVNNGGALLFAHRIKNRLPKWEENLKSAAKEYHLDWRLLAAISYQESHWNARAKSRTGVRGLMMLTRATAKDMGVTNRIDPSQSINGGAKYFKKIFDRIPKAIQGPDRTWLALAAYNVGYGHLEDARKLTEQHGSDPNKWNEIKKFLPLLAKRKYYKQTKHGYARGWEPVAYVQNIRNFYNILDLHAHMEQKRLRNLHNPTQQTARYQRASLPYELNLSSSIM